MAIVGRRPADALGVTDAKPKELPVTELSTHIRGVCGSATWGIPCSCDHASNIHVDRPKQSLTSPNLHAARPSTSANDYAVASLTVFDVISGQNREAPTLNRSGLEYIASRSNARKSLASRFAGLVLVWACTVEGPTTSAAHITNRAPAVFASQRQSSIYSRMP
jgi:hypothetical protein